MDDVIIVSLSKDNGMVIDTLCEFNRVDGDVGQSIRYRVVLSGDVVQISCLLADCRKLILLSTGPGVG